MNEPEHRLFAERISRRTFCQTSLAGLSLLAWGVTTGFAAGEDAANPEHVGVLVDLTRCVGCRACENACLIRWNNPGLPPASFGYGAGDGQLTYKTRCFVDMRNYTSLDGTVRRVPVKRQCMHCEHPACVSVCPVAAMEKTPRGPVVWHDERCMGCRYCMEACPFQVPRYEWDNPLNPHVSKCDLCNARTAAGQLPACVAACPTGALKYGTRADLLREAQARVKTQPNRYASLFGDQVVGGTSWLYLSDIPLEELGFPANLPMRALPSLTWNWLSRVPLIVVGLGAVLSVAYRLRGHPVRKAALARAHGGHA